MDQSDVLAASRTARPGAPSLQTGSLLTSAMMGRRLRLDYRQPSLTIEGHGSLRVKALTLGATPLVDLQQNYDCDYDSM